MAKVNYFTNHIAIITWDKSSYRAMIHFKEINWRD